MKTSALPPAAVALFLSLSASGVENIPEATSGTMAADAETVAMESAVDPAAWSSYRKSNAAPFLLFGEDRRFAVRNDIVPSRWLEDGGRAHESFAGKAQPGEFYPFQVCVVSDSARRLRWTAETDLAVTRVTPSECSVRAKGVKPIWVMVDIPKDSAGRTFRGSVRVEDADSGESRSIAFAISVEGAVLEDGGVSDAWRLSRLKWLESDVGSEDVVTKPFIPVKVDRDARRVSVLGRDVLLGSDGFPVQIVSRFSGSNTRVGTTGFGLLSSPFRFSSGSLPADAGSSFEFTEVTPTHASWRAVSGTPAARRIVEGRMDFTGSGSFRVRHEGCGGDCALEVRMPLRVARLMEGLGRDGGVVPDEPVSHRWDAALNRDAVWLGRVNGGLAFRFRGANYRRPLVNAYYAWRRLNVPESWGAGGGFVRVEKTASEVVVSARGSGAPEGAEWNFDLFVTPFRILDMKAHLSERYFHAGQHSDSLDFAKLRAGGATVVNLHHNTVWNPYINYPYNDDGGPLLAKAIDDAHREGLLLKVYYTTRELTQNMPEFFALKSLDGEVLLERDKSVEGWPVTNSKGPHEWLRTHVGDDIVPAWRESVRFGAYPERLDLAVLTTPESRWDNFYLSGLDYLVRRFGIDGLYIDDTALTADSMRRARRILDRDGRRRLVDNHSWNHSCDLAGYGSSNLVFIELYPYFDLLWRGEGFGDGISPEAWLVERSGAVFGLPGEVLECTRKASPYKGLVFGMTDRWGWGGNPAGIWRFFDEQRLGDMEFTGWWDEECPVLASGSPDVKVSAWQGEGRIVFVAANFAAEPRRVAFALRGGSAAGERTWKVPAIDGVQKASDGLDLSSVVEIPAGGGVVACSP